MEWSEFAVRFTRELAGLDRDAILIVRERDESKHYVQAMREPDRLYAEAVSNNFLDGALALTPADEEVLAESGWRPPTADWSPANWWTELPLTASISAHAELADMMVAALRDVQGVRRPADLVYESFHRDGIGLIELPDFGIEPADPSRITEQRRTAEPVAAPTTAGPPTLSPYEPSDVETHLADAVGRDDTAACYELLLSAELVLPATGQAVEDPSLAEFATTVVDDDTRVLVFTSPQALTEALGDRTVLHRKSTFGELAAAWPDPRWSLVVNSGLASEVRLDSAAVTRLDDLRQTAHDVSSMDTLLAMADSLSPAQAAPLGTVSPSLPVPHGARLWRLKDSTSDPVPIARYDAVSGRWFTSVGLPQGITQLKAHGR